MSPTSLALTIFSSSVERSRRQRIEELSKCWRCCDTGEEDFECLSEDPRYFLVGERPQDLDLDDRSSFLYESSAKISID
jgi:hypothetical protein